MSIAKKPVTLLILDGWGYSETPEHNAIHHAKTPVWDKAWAQYPHTLIDASEQHVGLPSGQMGNSEVGHLNLGAGRIVYQDFTRVSLAIEEKTFFTNPALMGAVDGAVEKQAAVHIMGLLSPGGVHSHEDHIIAMIELAVQRGAKKVYLHAFLDGRDTPPRSALPSIERLEATFKRLGVGEFASIMGRYYAMDRDNRWDRVQAAYDVITQGKGKSAISAATSLQIAYDNDVNDEFVIPTAILNSEGERVKMAENDALVFMNFRADRAREITKAFIEADFSGFERDYHPKLSSYVSLTEYHADFDCAAAYPPETLTNSFGEYLANQGLTQLRIAETEKYAHVTFFFSGGREDEYEGETRILVNSPNVATYDLQPEMSAPEVTEKLVDAISHQRYDAIVCNYANADMVGHTGNMAAATKAIEALDECVGKVIDATLAAGGELLITADHGNAEKMQDNETAQAHTAHTLNVVPLLYIGREAELSDTGALSDIAPTLLHLMGLEQPKEMTGKSCVSLKTAEKTV